MSVTIIHPSSIFNIKSISNQKFKLIESTVHNYKSAEILSPISNTVRIVFLEQKPNDRRYFYKGDDLSINQFTFTPETESEYRQTATGTITFKKNRLSFLNDELAPEKRGYSFIVKANFMDVLYSNAELTEVVSAEPISYEYYDPENPPELIDIVGDDVTVEFKVVVYQEYDEKPRVRYLLNADFYIKGYPINDTDYTFTDPWDWKHPNNFKTPQNELTSWQNEVIVPTSTLPTSLAVENASCVRKCYESGKEVYTLKCSVMDKPFTKYDIVEPYIFTSKGEVPLSTKEDGTAKQFEVIGVDISYSGVVWQEITIQEYVE